MEGHAQIVMGPDGTVLTATGDVPRDLVDTRLADGQRVSAEIREAGQVLLERLRTSGARIAMQEIVRPAGDTVQLIAVDAVPLRRVLTDVPGLLASKLAVVSSQASTVGVRLTVGAAPDVPPRVRVDAEKIAWAVTTLVGNALRYMQTGSRRLSGGRIDVSTTYDAAGSTLTIEVRDDGPGIPVDTVSRLFKRDGLNVRGSGLALLLMQDIMTAHGGTVDVRSSTDPAAHGTTIRLAFPAV